MERSTPYDAKGLLKSAIRSDDPVVFFEHKKFLWGGADGAVPEEDYTIPFGEAAIRREGKVVTIVTVGFMVQESLGAAQDLAEEGIDAEVIDLRTIVPLDKETIIKSLEKTGRLVVAEEGRIRGGLGAEIAALVCEHHLSGHHGASTGYSAITARLRCGDYHRLIRQRQYLSVTRNFQKNQSKHLPN